MKDKIEHCKNDIVSWAESYFIHVTTTTGKSLITFSDKQKEVLISFANDKRSITRAARQTGKTSLCIVYSLWQTTLFANKNVKFYTHSFISVRNIMSRIMFAYKNLLDILKPTIIKETETEVWFDNGSSIHVCNISATPISTSDCAIFDELAYCHIADRIIFDEENHIKFTFANDGVAQMLDNIPKIAIISTPYTMKDNIFSSIWNLASSNDEDNIWKKHTLLWNESFSMCDEKWKNDIISVMGLERWKNERECEFSEND